MNISLSPKHEILIRRILIYISALLIIWSYYLPWVHQYRFTTLPDSGEKIVGNHSSHHSYEGHWFGNFSYRANNNIVPVAGVAIIALDFLLQVKDRQKFKKFTMLLLGILLWVHVVTCFFEYLGYVMDDGGEYYRVGIGIWMMLIGSFLYTRAVLRSSSKVIFSDSEDERRLVVYLGAVLVIIGSALPWLIILRGNNLAPVKYGSDQVGLITPLLGISMLSMLLLFQFEDIGKIKKLVRLIPNILLWGIIFTNWFNYLTSRLTDVYPDDEILYTLGSGMWLLIASNLAYLIMALIYPTDLSIKVRDS